MTRHTSLLCLALAAGPLVLKSGCSRETAANTTETANSPAGAGVDRVLAGPPQRKTLELWTSQPGRIEAFESAPLIPKLGAYVEEVLVDIGDPVEKGQVLMRLWAPELRDERDQKEALVAQAAAEVTQAESAVVAAEAAVVSAQARIALAEAGVGRAHGEFERSRSEHERMKELAARGSQTQKLVDETLNQLRAAEAARLEAAANVESAKAGLREAEARVSKAQADLVAAQARHRVARADLKQAETMLAYTQIRAPFDGFVTRREVDAGHYVSPAGGAGARPLLVVARSDLVRVFVDVPEVEAPLVDAGQSADPAIVRVQSLGDRRFEASVTRTSWSLDASNRSLRTAIDIPNDEGRLRPGMFATVTIRLDQRDGALTLPLTAIIREGQNAYCCVVQSGHVARRPIELGLRSGNEVEIVSGLDDREIVVLARAGSLQNGQPVELIDADR